MSRIATRLAVLALLAAGCGAAPEPADLPAPRLDPTLAVRGARGEAPGTAGAAAARRSSFAERLARRSGEDGPAAAARDQPMARQTVALQTVALGNGLVADLPQRLGAWRWSHHDDLALGLYEQNGPAAALIYAAAQPMVPDGGPALASNRFLYAVEPGLASEWLLLTSEIGPLATQIAAGVPLGPLEAASALQSLATPTLGRGLGFRTDPGGFGGWKWIGENEHGVYLRLGRAEGIWGAQGALPEPVRVLAEALVADLPELEAILWNPEPAPGAETPASLWIGSASRGGRVVDLALLCRKTPRCLTEDDFTAFLSSLRPAGSGTGPSGGAGRRPHELAAEAGLLLAPAGWDLTPSRAAAAVSAPARTEKAAP